jgi:hypothetical protein
MAVNAAIVLVAVPVVVRWARANQSLSARSPATAERSLAIRLTSPPPQSDFRS